jgi:hypothetical protein
MLGANSVDRATLEVGFKFNPLERKWSPTGVAGTFCGNLFMYLFIYLFIFYYFFFSGLNL